MNLGALDATFIHATGIVADLREGCKFTLSAVTSSFNAIAGSGRCRVKTRLIRDF
jgi:hypothetical protein